MQQLPHNQNIADFWHTNNSTTNNTPDLKINIPLLHKFENKKRKLNDEEKEQYKKQKIINYYISYCSNCDCKKPNLIPR
jgi:hypothetical protein